MLDRLRDLVFGLGEFDKTKIEIRFLQVRTIIESLEILKIRDFELLEEVVYKIREQLRVRSSNLNKIVRNPAKNLKRSEVLDIVESLNRLKYDFLKKAFVAISVDSDSNLNLPVSAKSDVVSENLDLESLKEDNVLVDKVDFDLNNVNLEEPSSCIFDKNGVKVFVNLGVVPYVLVRFVKDVDFVFLKDLLVQFFDEFKATGSNIIVDSDRALLVFRNDNDNLFSLPNVEIDIDDVFSRYEKILSAKSVDVSNSVDDSSAGLDVGAEQSNVDSKEYFDIVKARDDFSAGSSKGDDQSLDDLLLGSNSSSDKKKDTLNFGVSKSDVGNEKIEFEKDDPIEFEKKKIIDKEGVVDGIEIVKEQSVEKNPKTSSVDSLLDDKGVKVEGVKVEGVEVEGVENESVKDNILSSDVDNSSKSVSAKSVVEKKVIDVPVFDYEVYRDEKIVSYFSSSSISKGEIIVEFLSGETFAEVSEGDLSYIMIFSKVFSSILFEIKEAHGTNLLFDLSSNMLRIVPRFQDDGLPLSWTPKQESDQFLDEIRKKLLDVMNREILGDKKDETVVDSSVVDSIDSKGVNLKNDNDESEVAKGNNKKSKKAKYVLDSLRRVP